ncbi:YbhB/YbcL family Raf kinase inhibitor-like protein [Candidatus Uhrbacteria bacterium]|nr:MAG: YbhB/YbcL family Raf kinase inhibitor-like protein [Candidatus Uhrbacteria bacterium]
MRLSSPAFVADNSIPSKYTCDGDDLVPPLTIDDTPAEAASFVMVVDDPDSPSGDWLHWLAYDIPGSTREILEGQEVGTQGLNSWNRTGYGGPCPGQGEHRYVFRLYALDKMLDLPPGARLPDVERAMTGAVLAEANLMGKYIKMENR